MAERDIDEQVLLFFTLSQSYRLISEKVEKTIYDNGLNSTEFAVLQVLYYIGDLQLQQLGKYIFLSSGSITYVVDKLEKKSLLERERCSTDRRVTYAKLTDNGHSLLAKILPDHTRKIKEIVTVLSEEEQKNLIYLLEKLVNKAVNE